MSGTLGIATLLTEVDLAGLDRGFRKANTETEDFRAKLSKNVDQAANVAFAAAGAAAVAFVASSINEFQTFERGMSEVFTLMPSITADAMAQMEEDVLAFGVQVGRTSDEVIPALYQSISAGVPPENVFDFMQVASDAALGGVTSLEVAVDGISSAVNAYGAEALSAQEASDLMFTAVKGGKTTFGDLAGSLFNVIPTAASLGVEFGNITAALAAMTAQGTPTSVATTQLRQLLIELSKEGSNTAATFERLAGESFVDFIAGGGNLQEALQLLEGAAADSGLRLSDMFGSVEAGAAALTLTGSGTAKFTAELDAAADSAGATAAAAETMGETGAQAVARLTAAFEALKITVGEQVAPVMADFAEKATKQLDLMTSTVRLNEMAGELRDVGLSMSEVNDIIDDGKPKFAIFRSQIRMEEDLARTEEGMRRMQFALEAVDLGLENNLATVSGLGGTYTTGRDAVSEYVEEQERLYRINQQNAQFDEILTRGTYDVREATIAASAATDGWSVAMGIATVATEAQTEVVEIAARVNEDLADKTAQLAAQEAAADPAIRAANLALQQQTEAAAAADEAMAGASARMAEYFVAATQATDAVGFFNTTTTDTGAVLVDTTVNQSSLNQAMYDAAVAAGASATELAVLGVATGVLSAEQAEAALKTAILQAGVAELAAAYVAGDLSISGLRTQMGLLVADVNNMDVAIGASTGEVDIYAGSISTAGAAALDAAVQIGGLRDAAEDAAGDYSIHFDITTTGSIPNGNTGGHQGSSGSGHQEYALGGYTGDGDPGDIAGLVHKREYVIPSEVVDEVGKTSLDEMFRDRFAAANSIARRADPIRLGVFRPTETSDDSGRGKMSVTIDLRNSQIHGVADFKRTIKEAMAEVGHQADVWIKTR